MLLKYSLFFQVRCTVRSLAVNQKPCVSSCINCCWDIFLHLLLKKLIFWRWRQHFTLNIYCISAACFWHHSSPQRPFSDISTNTFIFPFRYYIIWNSDRCSLCVSLCCWQTLMEMEKRAKHGPLSVPESVLHPTINPSPAAFGNECFLIQTMLLTSISLSPTMSGACWNEIHIRTQGLLFLSCTGP